MKRLLLICVLSCSIIKIYAADNVRLEDDSIYEGLNLESSFLLFMPNAFSPNGDGVNDFFAPVGVGVNIGYFEMRIYNRQGNLVFLTTDYNTAWDGGVFGKRYDETTTEVFAYHIIVRTPEGTEGEFFGHVTRLP